MTQAEAESMLWDVTTVLLGFVGFVAVLLLVLALIGLAGRW